MEQRIRTLPRCQHFRAAQTPPPFPVLADRSEPGTESRLPIGHPEGTRSGLDAGLGEQHHPATWGRAGFFTASSREWQPTQHKEKP